MWLGSGSGLPQGGIVRWMGKLPEMGSDLTVGIELVGIFNYKAFANEIFYNTAVSLHMAQLCV